MTPRPSPASTSAISPSALMWAALVPLVFPLTAGAGTVLDVHPDPVTREVMRLPAGGDVQIVEFVSFAGETRVSLELDGQPRLIVLHPHDLRGERFRLTAVHGNGHQVTVTAPPSRTWRGVVEGVPGSQVAASLGSAGLRLIVHLGDGEVWGVQPLPPSDPAAAPGAHLVYRERDVDWTGAVCAGTRDAGRAAEGEGRLPGRESEPGCGRLCQIAFDADNEYYLLNRESVESVLEDIEAVLNATEVIYEQDAGITYELTELLVRVDPDDPYTTNNAYLLWDQLAEQWNTHHGDIERDVVHLMTGRNLASGIIGIAELGVICTLDLAYGISQSHFTQNFSQRVGVTAHELGHNWNAYHCEPDVDCAIMCWSIGGCQQIHDRFGSRTLTSIAEHLSTRTCLADGEPEPPWAVPDVVSTLVGEPVVLDVLANDVSVTCRPLTLIGSPTSSAGALVTIAPGGGPEGRDALHYTPPAGFAWDDAVGYTVSDDQGLQSEGSARVSVLEFRSPDAPATTLPGVDVGYYPLQLSSLPDFDALIPYLTEMRGGTVNFPVTFRPFAGSGRGDDVGAVFEGTLDIPEDGLYTFFTESNEGSVLHVDGIRVVDNDGLHLMEEASGEIELTVGSHAVRVEYFEQSGTNGLIARIEGGGLEKQVIPSEMWVAPGIATAYYDLSVVSWLPDFDSLDPIQEDAVDDIDFPMTVGSFATSGMSDEVAALFEGYVTVPTTDVYRFHVNSDDGSALVIDGRRVVDNDGPHRMVERYGDAALEVGGHPVRVEYFDLDGPAGLQVSIEGGGLAKQIIPAAMWSRADPTTPVDPTGEPDLEPPAVPPSVLRLLPAHPNPFGSRTTIAFELPRSGRVVLEVFDAGGRRVRRLLDRTVSDAGRYRVSWDGRDDGGRRVSAGIYFHRLEVGGERLTRRVVVVR